MFYFEHPRCLVLDIARILASPQGGKRGGMGGVSLVLWGGVALTRQEKGGAGLILQKRCDMADDLR